MTEQQQQQRMTLQEKLIASRKALANSRGMTLVEVLIVLTIMASIMGVVGFVAVNALDKAGTKEAQIEISKIDQAVQQYQIMNSRKLPESLDDLAKQKFLPKVPKDPWNEDYVYRKVNDKTYEVFSKGPDQKEGTEDDVKKAD